MTEQNHLTIHADQGPGKVIWPDGSEVPAEEFRDGVQLAVTAAAQGRAAGLREALEDIRARRRTFAGLNADPQYLAALDDAYGLVNNRLSDVELSGDVPGQTATEPTDLVESLCSVMHDAYEAAAVKSGWETQERSRKPWEDVPEANKVTMRAAVSAALDALTFMGWMSPEEATAREAAARREAWDEALTHAWRFSDRGHLIAIDAVTPVLLSADVEKAHRDNPYRTKEES